MRQNYESWMVVYDKVIATKNGYFLAHPVNAKNLSAYVTRQSIQRCLQDATLLTQSDHISAFSVSFSLHLAYLAVNKQVCDGAYSSKDRK